MKRSKWQFKRLRFINPSFVRHDLPFVFAIATIVVAASCQLSRKTDVYGSQAALEDSAFSHAAAAPLHVRPPLMPEEPLPASPQSMLAMVRNIGNNKHTSFRVQVVDCGSPPETAVVQLQTRVGSDFGTQTINLTLRGDGLAEAVRADIEAYRLSFAVTAPIKASLVKQVCAANKLGTHDFSPELPIFKETQSWLSQIAPDCTTIKPVFEPQTEHTQAEPQANWYCHLPEVDPAKANNELVSIRTTMIRRWSRQPYLLARRLAVGVELAETLLSKNPEKRLDVFCRIIKGSLAVELPATVASKRWQNAVCNTHGDQRISAARFGLGKTTAEISFMRQLFDRTSRLGFLSLRIPVAEAPGRDILVSLTPMADVTDNVARETARLWLGESPNSKINFDAESPRSCWHPVYAEDSGLMRLARYLTLSGEAKKVACEESDMVPNDAFAPARYFAESITSETEFIATNGHAKMLRLPSGRYAYKLRVLPENFDDWDDASQVSEGATGEITWEAKRPRPTISKW